VPRYVQPPGCHGLHKVAQSVHTRPGEVPNEDIVKNEAKGPYIGKDGIVAGRGLGEDLRGHVEGTAATFVHTCIGLEWGGEAKVENVGYLGRRVVEDVFWF